MANKITPQSNNLILENHWGVIPFNEKYIKYNYFLRCWTLFLTGIVLHNWSHILAIHNLVYFRIFKKYFGYTNTISVSTYHWNYSFWCNIIRDIWKPKTPVFGLVLNLSHFGFFAPRCTIFLYSFGGYGSKPEKSTFVMGYTGNL